MYNQVIYPLYSEIPEPRSDKDLHGNVLATERYKGLRVQEIIDGGKEILHFTISAKEMYNKYLTPMTELSLINWQRSELKGNEKIFMPSDTEASRVHSLFPNPNDQRLEVSDKAFYPSKEIIEQSYGFRSKLSSEHGGKNNKNIDDIYRLEDHEGNEITLPDLIDKYLYNPEICFKMAWNEMESTDIRLGLDEPKKMLMYSTQILNNHLHNV